MRYELEAPLGTKPHVIGRGFLEKYKISAKLHGVSLMSDGSIGNAVGWMSFNPLFTGLAAAGASAGMIGGVMGPGGAVAGVLTGFIIDVLRSKGEKKENTEPPPPVPIATIIRIEFTNVSPARLRWAEYLLASFCRDRQWKILSPLIYPGVIEQAGRSRRTPIPWSESKGKRRRTPQGSAGTALDRALHRLVNWL